MPTNLKDQHFNWCNDRDNGQRTQELESFKSSMDKNNKRRLEFWFLTQHYDSQFMQQYIDDSLDVVKKNAKAVSNYVKGLRDRMRPSLDTAFLRWKNEREHDDCCLDINDFAELQYPQEQRFKEFVNSMDIDNKCRLEFWLMTKHYDSPFMQQYIDKSQDVVKENTKAVSNYVKGLRDRMRPSLDTAFLRWKNEPEHNDFRLSIHDFAELREPREQWFNEFVNQMDCQALNLLRFWLETEFYDSAILRKYINNGADALVDLRGEADDIELAMGQADDASTFVKNMRDNVPPIA